MLVINARFLTQDITGVQRFSIEISKKIKNIKPDTIFVSPGGILHREIADELDAVEIGRFRGHLWEQIDLPFFLKKNGNPLLLNFSNTAPIFYKNKISTIHDVAFLKYPESFSWKFRSFYKFIIPKVIFTSRYIFTVSNFSKKEIINTYKIDESSVDVIYNAVNSLFHPDKSPERCEYFLGVSSLSYQKNFIGLINAFNAGDFGDVELKIVGGFNRSFASSELLSLIDQNKKIKLLGRVSDEELKHLYSNALGFIFPSLYEGFGIPPLEAQACGCPVMSSNAASLPEVLGESALYFSPTKRDEIIEAMRRISMDEELRLRLVTNGFDNVSRFNWKTSANKILSVVEGLK